MLKCQLHTSTLIVRSHDNGVHMLLREGYCETSLPDCGPASSCKGGVECKEARSRSAVKAVDHRR